jgi:hypothetical protein
MNAPSKTGSDAVAAWDVLIKEIDETLCRVQRKRRSARRWSQAVFISQVCLIFLTTVLLGIKWGGRDITLANLALITSAGATLMSTIGGYFNFRDRWLEHTRTVGSLRALRGDAELSRLQAKGVVEPEPVEELRNRLREVLGMSMQRWISIKELKPPVTTLSSPTDKT